MPKPARRRSLSKDTPMGSTAWPSARTASGSSAVEGTLRFGMHQKVRPNPGSRNRGRKRGGQRRRPPCCLRLVGRYAGLEPGALRLVWTGRLLPTAVVRDKIIQVPDSLNRIPGFCFFWRVTWQVLIGGYRRQRSLLETVNGSFQAGVSSSGHNDKPRWRVHFLSSQPLHLIPFR